MFESSWSKPESRLTQNYNYSPERPLISAKQKHGLFGRFSWTPKIKKKKKKRLQWVCPPGGPGNKQPGGFNLITAQRD